MIFACNVPCLWRVARKNPVSWNFEKLNLRLEAVEGGAV